MDRPIAVSSVWEEIQFVFCYTAQEYLPFPSGNKRGAFALSARSFSVLYFTIRADCDVLVTFLIVWEELVRISARSFY
jgi:hypothetical protein